MSAEPIALNSRAADDPGNFSIVLGGPLYQLLRSAHVSGDALEHARGRILAIAGLAWLPLLVLSIVGGEAWRGLANVPFVSDIGVHVRFLIAVPLLVGAELLVHARIRPIAQEFLVRGLIPASEEHRYHASLAAAYRLRNSITAELAIIVFVYAVGMPYVWRNFGSIDTATWYGVPGPDGLRFTAAGMWYAYVSIPLFQFLLLRWYFRIFIWMRFLWHVSRIRLNLTAMHGDGAAGLGFLSASVFAFAPLLMAHGALLSGTIADRIFHMGTTLMDARYEIALVVAYLLAIVFLPLLVFVPQVSEAKRRAKREYGRLVQRYVVDFEERWLPGGKPAADSPLGAADMQSLADLNTSLEGVASVRAVPITRDAVLALAAAVLAPIAPLLLTVIPAEELATRVLKMLF